MKISSDLCGGISLLGALLAGSAALMAIMLLFSKNANARTFMFFLAVPAFFAGIIVFAIFYRESKRVRDLEAEEELIRKLALEKLENDKLGN
jgi:hypothetical protein